MKIDYGYIKVILPDYSMGNYIYAMKFKVGVGEVL